jgi:hypothetical protein
MAQDTFGIRCHSFGKQISRDMIGASISILACQHKNQKMGVTKSRVVCMEWRRSAIQIILDFVTRIFWFLCW